MRIVSLGVPLPNPQVDNHSIANAPSLFEYDACVIDPRSVSSQIEEIAAGASAYKTADAVTVQAGATGAFHYGLGELLEQRRDELTRLLERGGIVVVFGYPNVPHPTVRTLAGADRYTILPAAPGVIYRAPQLIPGDGRRVQADDPAHPFAVYLDDLASQLRYRAHWNTEAIPDFDVVGSVFGRSDGGAAAAVAFRVGAGQIVFLPPPATELRGKERRSLTDAVLESITRMLESPGGERPPTWLRDYALPQLDEAQTAVEAAQDAFAEAESGLVEARAHLTDATKYHGLLWRAGRFSFEPLVRDAFRELGFTAPPDLSQPAQLSDGETLALLEVDASSHAVKERAYLSLQRRIEQDFLRSGVRRKGVIVVNGDRLADPAQRKAPFSQTLANACENFGYALIPGEALFALVTYALEGADAETLAAIRATILNTDGLIQVEESEPDAEPEIGPEAAPDTTADATPDAEAESEPEPASAKPASGDASAADAPQSARAETGGD